MERWVGRVALVTGASSGSGKAVAKRLVGHGMKVVGCARNIEKIQELACDLKDENGSLTAIKCDISKEEDVLAMFDTIRAKYGVVDVCVNNAALAHVAPLLTGKTDDWRHMFDVNVIGLCTCTREAVRLMDERGVDDGHIFLMNSTVGHRILNLPVINMYSATKFAVTAIAEGLRNELGARKSYIRVTAISPGLVRSDFYNRMFPDNPEIVKAAHGPHEILTTDDVADSLVYALSAPKRTHVDDIFVSGTEITHG